MLHSSARSTASLSRAISSSFAAFASGVSAALSSRRTHPIIAQVTGRPHLPSMPFEHMVNDMPMQSNERQSDTDIEADVDTVIAACGGDARAAVRTLIVAYEFLSTELERVRASVSIGYTRRH